jgi:hypothetical protein
MDSFPRKIEKTRKELEVVINSANPNNNIIKDGIFKTVPRLIYTL